MNSALMAGVSGLQAHQQMLDVAGNNLANVNTDGFKASRVTFSELLEQTLQEAGQPTASTGGTNPVQVGTGAQVASIDRNMTQGTLVTTGQPLDMAIDGQGYFVLNDGKKNVYTRVGTFNVDSQYYLVDSGTGSRVQRIGAEGIADGFQNPNDSNIRLPYDTALPARATENVTFTGNLSADTLDPTTTVMSSGIQYTKDGAVASSDTLLADLDQIRGIINNMTIDIEGTRRDGTAVSTSYTVLAATSTVGDLLDAITAAFANPDDATDKWSVASMSNGEIRLSDATSGYSLTDMSLSSSTIDMDFPDYFKYLAVGGESARNTNINVYDTQGNSHTLAATFVKGDTNNSWDMVVTSLSGDATLQDRRITGIQFLTDGSFGGVETGEPSSIKVTYGNDPTNIREINVNLGSIGQLDGLSQFGGSSTVAPSSQDGYAAGWLSSVSVTNEGVLEGVFTNGARRDLAALQIATFQNPAGLLSAGGNFFVTSANSGDAVTTKAMAASAGSVTGGALEKSNVDVSAEFVNLIEAQNGYQANARTIKVANDMLQELTNLTR